MQRCTWVNQDPLYIAYHDDEWGVPVHDSQKLFEKLCLEGQQAGLSWITVLKKRETYRQCFHQFDPHKVAAMTEADVDRLMQNPGLIRHRGKLEAIINNAKICWIWKKMAKASLILSGLSSITRRSLTISHSTEKTRSPPQRQRQTPWLRRSKSAASSLLAPPFATPTCSQWGW